MKTKVASLLLLSALCLFSCRKDEWPALSVEVSCATTGFVVSYTYGEGSVEQVVDGRSFTGKTVRVPAGTRVTALAQATGTQSLITLSVLRNGIIVQTATDTGDYCIAACDVVF